MAAGKNITQIKFMTKFLIVFFFSFTSLANESIKLEWTSIQNGIYKIQISKEKNFSHPIINKELTENHFNFQNYGAGVYYWRVKSRTKETDKWLYVTEIAQIKLSLTPLKASGPGNKTIDSNKASATFRWNLSNVYPSYEFRVFNKGDKKPFLRKRLAGKNSLKVDLAPGEYDWSVIQKDSSGVILQESRPQSFVFTKITSPPPKKKTAKENSNLLILSPNENLFHFGPSKHIVTKFKWEKKPNLNYKFLRLGTEKQKYKVRLNNKLPSIKLKKNMNYHWVLEDQAGKLSNKRRVRVQGNEKFETQCQFIHASVDSNQKSKEYNKDVLSELNHFSSLTGCEYEHYHDYSFIHSFSFGAAVERHHMDQVNISDSEISSFQALSASAYANYSFKEPVYNLGRQGRFIKFSTGIEFMQIPFYEIKNGSVEVSLRPALYAGQKALWTIGTLPFSLSHSLGAQLGYDFFTSSSSFFRVGYSLTSQRPLAFHSGNLLWQTGVEYTKLNSESDGLEHAISKIGAHLGVKHFF
ncbi:MAG: hypothetical protein WD025_00190 [Bacteriovoracaceae bacterium]